jgi:hypothetical protein
MSPPNQDDADESDIFDAVRMLVREQLDAGLRASNISFALTYIAVELGLTVATDRAAVYPVVMAAISEAATADSARRNEESVERSRPKDSEPPAAVPVGATVH